MFWKYNQTSPQIDTVFKEDTTLNEVLDQENVLQELKSQNKKLIEFITRADILNQLVGLVTEEPSNELEEHERYRRPNLACEVLTTDIPILNERLSDKALLTKLYSFLEKEPPLNPLLASFFSRTLSMLICRKADQHWYSYQFTCLQVLDFLKTKENSLNLLLKHLDTSAVMDFIFKLITQMEGNEMQQNLISWLESEGFIENIIGLFDPSIDEGRHYNAAQLLCDTIRKCREISERNDPGPILSKIQSPEIIQKLLDTMLNGEHIESSIVGGISVLLTLLEPPPSDQMNRRGAYNNIEDNGSGEPPPTPNPALPSMISYILPYLPALHNLLVEPPKGRFESDEAFAPLRFELPNYVAIQSPLGNTRLTVIKFISALIATSTPEVNKALDSLDTVRILLDLFFHYTWNNFLHSQVDKCLAFALNSGSEYSQNPLIPNIFIKCRLLQRILEAWKENESEQSKDGGKRRGYMGHLINIANSVIKQEDLTDFINENIDQETVLYWGKFVEDTLQPINDLHQQFLGGKHPAHGGNKDDDMDYKDANFSSENSNQGFNEYATNAALTNNFIESFASFDSDQKIINSQEDGDNDRRAEMFKEICSQKKSFEDMETTMEDEEVWEYNIWNNSDDHSSSSDEEEEKVSPKSPREKNTDSAAKEVLPILEQVNPWSEPKSNETVSIEEGWANFATFDEQFVPTVESQKIDNQENDIASAVSPQLQNKESLPEDESCNRNINANDLVLEDILPEEEDLIDNFRFLSIQGMIAEKKVNTNAASEVNTNAASEVNTNVVSEDTITTTIKTSQEESKDNMHKESRTPCEAHEPDPV